ncbi:MAG: hypothetical protein J6W65_03615, partial [Oscillospiraceae bacterium]|nr:hypothetical protein [Oscillospiraceae bacterium]
MNAFGVLLPEKAPFGCLLSKLFFNSPTFFISQHLDNDINIRYNIYIKVSEGDDYMENEVKLKMISDNN